MLIQSKEQKKIFTNHIPDKEVLYPEYIKKSHNSTIKKKSLVGHGGSHLESQHFGRPRQVDHLRSGVQDQTG